MDPVGSLVSLFGVCASAYKIFLDVAGFEKLSGHIRWKLKKEQVRLTVWGRSWGLIPGLGGGYDSRAEGWLNEHLRREGTTDFIVETLARLSETFLDAKQLSSRYGLINRNPASQMSVSTADASVYSSSISLGMQAASISRIQQRAEKISWLSRCAWAIKDKDKMEQLASDLEELNTALYDLCNPNEKAHLMRAFSAGILPVSDLLLQASSIEVQEESPKTESGQQECTTHCQLVPIDGSQNGVILDEQVSAALKRRVMSQSLKPPLRQKAPSKSNPPPSLPSSQTPLEEAQLPGKFLEERPINPSQVSEGSDASKHGVPLWRAEFPQIQVCSFSRAHRLRLRDFTFLGKCGQHRYFVLHQRSKKYAVLEWKEYGVNGQVSTKAFSCINDLVQILSFVKPSPEIRVLSCLGYIEDVDKMRCGLLFGLPESYASVAKSPQRQSLNRVLAKVAPPPLDTRFNIARLLSRTVLQLHISGWVHKEIRPSNILFFGTEEHTMAPQSEPPGSPFPTFARPSPSYYGSSVPINIPLPRQPISAESTKYNSHLASALQSWTSNMLDELDLGANPTVDLSEPWLFGFSYSRPAEGRELSTISDEEVFETNVQMSDNPSSRQEAPEDYFGGEARTESMPSFNYWTRLTAGSSRASPAYRNQRTVDIDSIFRNERLQYFYPRLAQLQSTLKGCLTESLLRSGKHSAIWSHLIYQHPDHQLLVRNRYRQSYDVYSLGLVMVELLFWQPLGDILCISPHNNTVEIVFPGLDELDELFQDKMSFLNQYCDVIQTCLTAASTGTKWGGSSTIDRLCWDVVKELDELYHDLLNPTTPRTREPTRLTHWMESENVGYKDWTLEDPEALGFSMDT